MNNRLFISGIPAAGKSYLARKLAKHLNGIHIPTDAIYKEKSKDPDYKKWINFYWDKDEKIYYENTTPDDQWKNLKEQSEHLWPLNLEKIRGYEKEFRFVVFEGVNMLPHLARQDLGFPGIVLLGSSFKDILKRNHKHPRWGSTAELQKIEAESFWNIERPRYKAEAERCGYPTFENGDDAFEYVIKRFTTQEPD